jgi:glycosyl transferase family 1
LKIYYCGNFLPSHSTENHLARTLRGMGHDVVELQENFIQPDHLAQRLNTEEFDLFMLTRTWGETVKLDHLDILKKRKIPSVSYHLDLYHGLQRDGGIETDSFWRTDMVFTPDGDPKSAEFFKKKGINHYYMKPGVFADECYLVPGAKDKEVIFVGSYNYHPEWQYRPQLIDWLKANYQGFELWGSHGLGEVRENALNELYGRTKVVVGDSLRLPNHDYYWSDRVYETLGRGGFLIHPFIQGLQDEFTDKEHLVFYEYGNFGQLHELIDYYLSHDVEREEIRMKGHELVKNNYTYTQRLTKMLETVANARLK